MRNTHDVPRAARDAWAVFNLFRSMNFTPDEVFCIATQREFIVGVKRGGREFNYAVAYPIDFKTSGAMQEAFRAFTRDATQEQFASVWETSQIHDDVETIVRMLHEKGLLP